MPYEPYPRMLYRHGCAPITVKTQEEEDAAIAAGWVDHPDKAQPDKAAAPESLAASAAADLTSRSDQPAAESGPAPDPSGKRLAGKAGKA